ncbi:cell wall hydrolase [Azospirillum sp. YIM B02556]|uniref:Cell wall hydrolase n=1 Tax=Azospirillum endophyticum TaxID=2800326 RepID=A0ABS1F0F0_9PROT|nr:cell wall hydrolase [Azospirillum endophyticum]MBK1836890.1 cell wall hydrolase [Azospirillum endophyticum]
MRNLLPVVTLAISVLPAAAGAQVIDAGDAVCRPGDTACARFVGDGKGGLPKRSGEKQPVMIGTSVYMLTPWQAERERRCLALAGWAEARGEGADAMAAVMWVVANRAASADQPSLPCRVVVAAGQFEPFAAEPVEPKNRQKGKVVKPGTKPKQTAAEQAKLAADPRVEARRILAAIRRQATVIRAGGMPSWPKPRLAADQEALRIARGLAWNLNDDDLPDPTARASLFYSPPTQAALRRQKPDWAEARLLTTSIGGHSFYRYPAPPEERTTTQVAEVGE